MKKIGFLLIFYSLHMFAMDEESHVSKKVKFANSFVRSCSVPGCTLLECKELPKKYASADENALFVKNFEPLSFEKFLKNTNKRFQDLKKNNK